MSFKHTKFDDSETMRSFAKVGVEKGLVTPETSSVVKTASSKISATGDLVQDVMILCASLRKAGMEKHAEDLENNFLLYKKSESLYETFKETGEDLVDMAHPEGSHKLQDLEHTVLTITDRHKKIKDIVNKKPTGKLDGSLKRLAAKNNSNKNKLNIIKSSFKVSLAQEPDRNALNEKRQEFALNMLRKASSHVNEAIKIMEEYDIDYQTFFNRDLTYVFPKIISIASNPSEIKKYDIDTANTIETYLYRGYTGTEQLLLKSKLERAKGDVGLNDYKRIMNYIVWAKDRVRDSQNYIKGANDDEVTRALREGSSEFKKLNEAIIKTKYLKDKLAKWCNDNGEKNPNYSNVYDAYTKLKTIVEQSEQKVKSGNVTEQDVNDLTTTNSKWEGYINKYIK